MTHGKTTLRAGLAAAVCAAALGAGGCGYSIPFLAPPAANGAATHAEPAKVAEAAKRSKSETTKVAKAQTPKPAKSRKSVRSKRSNPEVASEPAPRVPTLRDQLDDARAHATQAPAEPYWPYHAATLYLAMGVADSALDALFSKLEYDAGRHDDAIAVLESARVAAQRTAGELAPELLAGLALHYDAAGRAAEAKEALGASAPSAHKTTDASAAAVALRGADAAAAAKLAEAAVDEHPKSAACQNNAGIARLRAGDVAAARKAFIKAIDLEPRRAGPYYNLAILEKYYALDDAAAARWFAEYRARSSDDPDGLGAVLGTPEQKDLAEGSKP